MISNDLQHNLLTLYADQLIKAEGDIKNNPNLTKESIEYLNKHGVMVRKTVYKSYSQVASHQDLISGDSIRCTTKSGKVIIGTYTRKTSQVKKGVKTEFLEFIKPDGSKGYVSLNGSVKLEKLLAESTSQAKSYTAQESIDKLKSLGANVYVKEGYSSAGPLSKEYQDVKFDFYAIYQGYVEALKKSTNGQVVLVPSNFKLNVYGRKVELIVSSSVLSIDRTIMFSIDRVNHDFLEISKDYQDSSLGKDLFKTLYKQYLSAGIKRITVHANINIGGYSWMAYGFSCDLDQAKRLVAEFKADLGISYKVKNKLGVQASQEITRAKVNSLTKIINEYEKSNPSANEIPMNLLSSASKDSEGFSVFKSFIIGNTKSWYGTLDLTDPSRKEYFETYIGYNK